MAQTDLTTAPDGASISLRDQAVAALLEVRKLFGPDAASLPPEDTVDETTIEQLVDDALSTLTAALPRYTGPEAPRAATVALRLSQLRYELASETIARRLDGLSRVQRALARLRAIGSTEQMIAMAPQIVCEHCGFKIAILQRVQNGLVTPAAAYSTRDPDWFAKVTHFMTERYPAKLDAMMLETEMLRRRAPVIVHDAMNDPRAHRELTRASGIRSYVAAPIMPEGRVIGFLHASTLSSVDIVDRDILWAFAEGYGYALERTILLERLHEHGERMRQLVQATETALAEMREADLQIAAASLRLEGRDSSEPARSTMFVAPDSRIHQLLTRRELEIIELMAGGETNRAIAQRFVVSEGTVKSHVRHILRKLHAANRAEAVSRYVRLTQAS
jgi:DNA-binding CsgD family transcriptional regulator